MKLDIYSLWMDPILYISALGVVIGIVLLIYAVKRVLEIGNAADIISDSETPGEEPTAEPKDDAVAAAAAPVEELPPGIPLEDAEKPAEEPRSEKGAGSGSSPAEVFLKGIYSGLEKMDARLKHVEETLSKGKTNNDFTIKFLEDILQDLESLDKEKLGARIKFLIDDLKK